LLRSGSVETGLRLDHRQKSDQCKGAEECERRRTTVLVALDLLKSGGALVVSFSLVGPLQEVLAQETPATKSLALTSVDTFLAIDLIAFKGLNDSMEEIEIVFIEVKTGRSVLSARERAVKKAVQQKRVSWRVFNPDTEVDRQKGLIAADG
jgi:hypothetical protein